MSPECKQTHPKSYKTHPGLALIRSPKVWLDWPYKHMSHTFTEERQVLFQKFFETNSMKYWKLVCQASLQAILKIKKHCYPVTTRHKEVTTIAARVAFFTDGCAYCKIKAWLPGPHNETPDLRGQIKYPYISEMFNTVTRNPTKSEGMFPQGTAILVRRQGGSIDCAQLTHS